MEEKRRANVKRQGNEQSWDLQSIQCQNILIRIQVKGGIISFWQEWRTFEGLTHLLLYQTISAVLGAKISCLNLKEKGKFT